MAVSLFKIVVDATTTTNTSVEPDVVEYFYDMNPTELTGDTLTIPANLFTDGGGNPVTGALTVAVPDNGYYTLFINGVLQQSGLYTVNPDGSQVVINEASEILTGSPITLIVTNFTADSTSTTTVTT